MKSSWSNSYPSFEQVEFYYTCNQVVELQWYSHSALRYMRMYFCHLRILYIYILVVESILKYDSGLLITIFIILSLCLTTVKLSSQWPSFYPFFPAPLSLSEEFVAEVWLPNNTIPLWNQSNCLDIVFAMVYWI